MGNSYNNQTKNKLHLNQNVLPSTSYHDSLNYLPVMCNVLPHTASKNIKYQDKIKTKYEINQKNTERHVIHITNKILSTHTYSPHTVVPS